MLPSRPCLAVLGPDGAVAGVGDVAVPAVRRVEGGIVPQGGAYGLREVLEEASTTG